MKDKYRDFEDEELDGYEYEEEGSSIKSRLIKLAIIFIVALVIGYVVISRFLAPKVTVEEQSSSHLSCKELADLVALSYSTYTLQDLGDLSKVCSSDLIDTYNNLEVTVYDRLELEEVPLDELYKDQTGTPCTYETALFDFTDLYNEVEAGFAKNLKSLEDSLNSGDFESQRIDDTEDYDAGVAEETEEDSTTSELESEEVAEEDIEVEGTEDIEVTDEEDIQTDLENGSISELDEDDMDNLQESDEDNSSEVFQPYEYTGNEGNHDYDEYLQSDGTYKLDVSVYGIDVNETTDGIIEDNGHLYVPYTSLKFDWYNALIHYKGYPITIFYGDVSNYGFLKTEAQNNKSLTEESTEATDGTDEITVDDSEYLHLVSESKDKVNDGFNYVYNYQSLDTSTNLKVVIFVKDGILTTLSTKLN